MKINYHFIARALIALLFVVAGVQKIMGFSGTAGFIGSIGVPMATIVTALVILIEVPVALAFAWGYRLCTTGGILAFFTLLTILLVHNHWPADLVMILKNLAIIGGILSVVTTCSCGKCWMKKGCKECKSDKKCEKCSA